MEQAQSEREIIDLEHAYWRAIQEQDVDAAMELTDKRGSSPLTPPGGSPSDGRAAELLLSPGRPVPTFTLPVPPPSPSGGHVMALTIGKSPLSRPRGGVFNFDIEHLAPEHILYLEDVQKRIRGVLAGETIVDTRRGKMLHETGSFAQWYVPRDDVRAEALEPGELRRTDPFKGVTTYYHVRAGNRLERDAAWSHEQPPGGFPLAGLVAFKFDKLDTWFEEDDPIRGHPRDPYHRFDCRHTSEHVLVRVGGEVVAETRCAIKLFETSIPPRYYIPMADVRPGCLVPSVSPRTYCPYKGEAAYFTVHAGATTVRDGAWTLPGPLGEALLTLGHVSFWGKNTEVIADGRPTPL